MPTCAVHQPVELRGGGGRCRRRDIDLLGGSQSRKHVPSEMKAEAASPEKAPVQYCRLVLKVA